MGDQEHDWLDERMAELPYIPDGGFTERVVNQLPIPALEEKGRVRRHILLGSTCCALAVGVVLAITNLPLLVHGLTPSTLGFPITEAANHCAELIRKPMVLYSGMALITLSGFAVLPFLRRWV